MKTTTLALVGILLGSVVAMPAVASSNEISGPTPEQAKAHAVKKAEKKAMHKKGKHFKKAGSKAKDKKAR